MSIRLWFLIFAGLFPSAVPVPAFSRPRAPKAVIEFAPQSRASLGSVEVEISSGETASPSRQPVTDAALFVSKAGGDANAALQATGPPGQPPSNSVHFAVRLFIVAGGRLYTGARGKCAPWDGEVARCSAECDGGVFALRRNGAAPLELLLGAIAGAEAGTRKGITISACGFDEETDVRLVIKSGRGLSAITFEND